MAIVLPGTSLNFLAIGISWFDQETVQQAAGSRCRTGTGEPCPFPRSSPADGHRRDAFPFAPVRSGGCHAHAARQGGRGGTRIAAMRV